MPKYIFFSSSSSDSEPEDICPPPPKKAKSTDGSNTDVPHKWIIQNKRQLNVQEFRGQTLVDIRDYYTKDGQDLPSKKGISLTVKQWKKLQEFADEIDEALKD